MKANHRRRKRSYFAKGRIRLLFRAQNPREYDFYSSKASTRSSLCNFFQHINTSTIVKPHFATSTSKVLQPSLASIVKDTHSTNSPLVSVSTTYYAIVSILGNHSLYHCTTVFLSWIFSSLLDFKVHSTLATALLAKSSYKYMPFFTNLQCLHEHCRLNA